MASVRMTEDLRNTIMWKARELFQPAEQKAAEDALREPVTHPGHRLFP